MVREADWCAACVRRLAFVWPAGRRRFRSAPRPQPGWRMLALVLSLSLCVPSRPVAIPARRGSGSLPASKRNVVLYPQLRGPNLLDQVGQIAAVLDEVDVRAVDHEEWDLRVRVKVAPECLRQTLQILVGD